LALAVRQAAHRGLELASAASVARLELELARENRRVVEARLEEGRASLRDLERARVEAGEKEIAFLDAAHDRELADLELARATGRIARFFPEAETPLGSMSNREANGLLTGAPPAP
jgi:outer membrane protein TolC